VGQGRVWGQGKNEWSGEPTTNILKTVPPSFKKEGQTILKKKKNTDCANKNCRVVIYASPLHPDIGREGWPLTANGGGDCQGSGKNVRLGIVGAEIQDLKDEEG